MNRVLIKNAKIVNEGVIVEGDVLIEDQIIVRISDSISALPNCKIVDAEGNYLLPGIIDDQVHFREPGLTHKGDIESESKAAISGGITSFIEQPNTVPNAVTHEILEKKYQIASEKSYANYSFMLGATNDNIEEVLITDVKNIAGVKVFMGSSTGNMLVDNDAALEKLFSNSPTLIAAHCEDEATIRKNLEVFREKYGDNIKPEHHPLIRSAEACYLSSSKAVALANKTGARLHIFHISTAKETDLFSNKIPIEQKKITAEACVHHLWFSDADYKTKGNLIKWNPAVKTDADRTALWLALLDDRIDVIATDHAPHTLDEKKQSYLEAPSGGPLVQHALVAMLEQFHKGRISIEKIVEKMAHNPAKIFKVEKRGFIREGYFADLVILNTGLPWNVKKENILAKCGWSPFEGYSFKSRVTHTMVNGEVIYQNSKFTGKRNPQRLQFDRP